MKLFIPELGSIITLTKKWTFDLYDESRNESMMIAAGLRLSKPKKPKIKLYIRTVAHDTLMPLLVRNLYNYAAHHNVVPQRWPRYPKRIIEYHYEWPVNTNDEPAYNKYLYNLAAFKNQRRLNRNGTQLKSVKYFLPKGTVLKVDRIYIRKGNSDFSSITFWTQSTKPKMRFWVKLQDANNIHFRT